MSESMGERRLRSSVQERQSASWAVVAPAESAPESVQPLSWYSIYEYIAEYRVYVRRIPQKFGRPYRIQASKQATLTAVVLYSVSCRLRRWQRIDCHLHE